MSKALYNGYELPALPEWDTTEYPYAYIWFPYNSPIEFWLVLIPAEAEFVYNSNVNLMFSASHYVRYSAQALDEAWSGPETVEVQSGNGVNVWKPESVDPDEYFTTCWANFDIYAEDGTLLLAASEPVPIPEKGFDLKSWLTGFALGLSGKPLPLSTGKKLVGYSYNGTVLPKLPEWDKTVYPYAYITEYYTGGYICFLAHSNAKTVDQYDTITNSIVTRLEYDLVDGAWSGGEKSGYTGHYLKHTVLWTNTDLYYSESIEEVGGTLYMSASEPVPVYE